MLEEITPEELTASLFAAAANLKPQNPEQMASKSLVPYFKEFGLNEDNIVPAGLKEYTSQILEILDLPPTMQSLHQMLEVPEVKATLTSAIAKANQVYEERKNKPEEVEMPDMSNIEGISPDMMQHFVQKAQQEQEMLKSKTYSDDIFVDPFKQDELKSEEPVKEKAIESPKESLEDKPAPLPTPEEKPLDEEIKAHFCPRCGWAVDMPYKPESLTEDDRIRFVYSIIHRMPFKKTYTLFDGQIDVTFHSKSTEESNLILEQLRKDSFENKYVDITHMTYFANKYELALLLDSISGSDKDWMLNKKPEFKDYKGQENAVAKYTEDVFNNYIASEVLRQLIERHFITFNRTYSTLMDEAMKENFYSPA